MSIKNLYYKMNEITKQIAKELENSTSTRQVGVITCIDIEGVVGTIIDISTDLIEFINNTIIPDEENRDLVNHTYIAQLQRLVCILELLISKLESFSCTENCPDLLEELLCILTQILNLLFDLFANIAFLDLYRDASIFFECLLCNVIDEIANLEDLVKDLVCILMSLLSCDLDNCTPCYVATNSGKRPTPRPPINICLDNKDSTCSCKK